MSHATLAGTGPGYRRPAPPDGPVRKLVRGFGELLLTLGLVVLLFVFYELVVTNWLSAIKQQQATAELNRQWQGPPEPLEVAPGEPFAKIFIPAFGPDYSYTVLQGTSQENLEVGPGHYIGTAMPGQPGNFALAGHRVGTGSPFLNLGELESCDALIIETARAWYVYKVLPLQGEAAGWGSGKGATPHCDGVRPLPPPYQDVPGRLIVDPSAREVLAPVPGKPQAQVPAAEQFALITLTTCHPKFSAQQRMIIHGVLTGQYPKTGPPPDVLGT